jgi:hypothetical protein
MMDDREKLARTLVRISGNDPDQLVPLQPGELTPLWEIAARSLDKLPAASLRTMLDRQARATGKETLSVSGFRRAFLAFKQALRGGWISPRDDLPPRSKDEDSALSEPVLVKHYGRVEEARLLYGTPVGSHRWIFGPQEFAHVLDIQGWKHIKNKDTP